MKKLDMFRRIAIITAASFGAAAIGSSAQAQDPTYCHQYAWQTCSFDEWGRPIQVTYECYSYEYEQCMGGPQAALDAYRLD